MSLLDQAKAAAQDGVAQAKEGAREGVEKAREAVDEVQAEGEQAQAYGELGREAYRLSEGGEASLPGLEDAAAKTRAAERAQAGAAAPALVGAEPAPRPA